MAQVDQFNGGLSESAALRAALEESQHSGRTLRRRRQSHHHSSNNASLSNASSNGVSNIRPQPRNRMRGPQISFGVIMLIVLFYTDIPNPYDSIAGSLASDLFPLISSISNHNNHNVSIVGLSENGTSVSNSEKNMETSSFIHFNIWEVYPQGSFVYDFWIVVLLSICVLVISFVSLLFKLTKRFHWVGQKLLSFCMNILSKFCFQSFVFLTISCLCCRCGFMKLKHCSYDTNERSEDNDSTISSCYPGATFFWFFYLLKAMQLVCFWLDDILKFYHVTMFSFLYDIPYKMIEILKVWKNKMIRFFERVFECLSIITVDFILNPISIIVRYIWNHHYLASFSSFLLKRLIILKSSILHFITFFSERISTIYHCLSKMFLRIQTFLSEKMTSMMKSLISSMKSGLTSLWNISLKVSKMVKTMVSRLVSFFRDPIFNAMKSLISSMKSGLTSLWNISLKVSKMVKTMVSRLVNTIISYMVNPIKRMFNSLSQILHKCFRFMNTRFWMICTNMRIFLQPVCVKVKTMLIKFFVHFTRAWWRVIPSILSVKTCYLFLSIPIKAYYSYFTSVGEVPLNKPVFSAMVGYLIAGWSVGIISFILLKDFYFRAFRWSSENNRQFVSTCSTSRYYNPNSPIDRMLEHVDLGSVNVSIQIIKKLYKGMGILLGHMVNFLDFLWLWFLFPIFIQIKKMILVIWRSPILCSSATIALLSLLFAHHQNIYKWEKLEYVIAFIRDQGLNYLVTIVSYVMIQIELVVLFLLAIINNTKIQLISAIENQNVESPRLAWCAWSLIVFATKAQPEIRIKTMNWPFLVLWLTAACGYGAYLTQVLFAVFVWCLLGIVVRNYEESERQRIHIRAQQRSQQRSQRVSTRRAPPQPITQNLKPKGPGRKVVFTDQTECSICLDDIPDAVEAGDDVGMLPCGHRFHTKCIGQWLQHESRCPICRQAAHGIDRVLEIVF